MWDEDDKLFKGFTLEQLQEPEPVKYKKTGGRRKGKDGPGTLDKAVGNWLTWRGERRANRQRLIDEQEAQSKARRQGNRNWILRQDRDVTWQTPDYSPRALKRVKTRDLRTARKAFANLSSEDKLNLHLQNPSSNALDEKSKQSNQATSAGEVNKEVPHDPPDARGIVKNIYESDQEMPMLNLRGTNSLTQIYKNNPEALKIIQNKSKSHNTQGDQSKVKVDEKRREAIEKGEKDKTKVETKAKPKLSTLGHIHKWSGAISDIATAMDPKSKPTQYMKEFDLEDPIWWS